MNKLRDRCMHKILYGGPAPKCPGPPKNPVPRFRIASRSGVGRLPIAYNYLDDALISDAEIMSKVHELLCLISCALLIRPHTLL